MQTKLKDAIIKAVQEHINEFQLSCYIRETFRQYIYTAQGEYLIGGEEVANFISEFIKLYNN